MIYAFLRNHKVKYIETPGCWKAYGEVDKDGYIRWSLGSKRIRAHRLIYYLLYPNTPTDLYILHHCGTPSCVRPDHLYAGTQKDNIQDQINQGTNVWQKYPKFQPNVILTNEEVEDIKGFIELGLSLKYIANLYNVAYNTIYGIKTGYRRKEV